ncbi:uncharacterized protein LOC133179355 [Saccostrea echinata]|uniref:uncharacterized protein LOC133179355 n=1 Tax=Saccostrea echinata TaxID=191078 RepID=UPI002A7F0692|nr:uncharacterized protein LOC133179355 [Saccostrea echinata]
MKQSVGVIITPAETGFVPDHFLSRGLGRSNRWHPGRSIISCSSHTEGGCLTSSRVSRSTLVNGAGKTPELPRYRRPPSWTPKVVRRRKADRSPDWSLTENLCGGI